MQGVSKCPLLSKKAYVQGVKLSFSVNSLNRDFVFQNIKVSAVKSIFRLVFMLKEHHKEAPKFTDVMLAHIC